MEDLDLPIALRRSRRCSTRVNVKSEVPPAVSTAPRTPHRRRRGARFSDPGSIISSGLTPMVRRTYLASPKSQRSTAHTRNIGGSRLANTTPSSTLRPNGQSVALNLNLHQTIDGRVERRMRRNGLRDMLNKIEQEKRRKEQSAQAQIARLKAEVKARDREIYDLQNATVMIDTDRIWDLEQQIDELKGELARRSLAKEGVTQYYSWAKASSEASTDAFMDMARDEDHFGDVTMLQLQASTPSRARSSFLTPPATSPPMPASPCSRDASPTPASRDVPAYFPDSDKKQLEEEIASLQFEVHKLTATLDSYNALGVRIGDALSNGPPEGSGALITLETIENQVQLLLQTMSDRATAATHLTSAISELGFPGDDASEMILSVTAGFRAARLELEYLTPGEITLPLTSHGAEVLDLLLTRLRALAKKSKEDDDSIDEYYEIEQSLRKQLDARVSVMDELNEKIATAYRMLDEKDNRIRELEVGNDRLKGAVDGYVRDIAELEKLVERMENEHRESTTTHAVQQQSSEELLAAKDVTIAELEAKIEEAVVQTTELLKEMSAVEACLTRQTAVLNRQHGAALALRDARVSELRGEIDRVNESLRVAHGTIHVLRIENSGMKGQLEEEKKKAKDAMDSMKGELRRVLHLSQSFLDDPRGAPTSGRGEAVNNEPGTSRTIVRAGGYLAGSLRRRGSKTSRRYDSGLELLDEDEVDI